MFFSFILISLKIIIYCNQCYSDIYQSKLPIIYTLKLFPNPNFINENLVHPLNIFFDFSNFISHNSSFNKPISYLKEDIIQVKQIFKQFIQVKNNKLVQTMHDLTFCNKNINILSNNSTTTIGINKDLIVYILILPELNTTLSTGVICTKDYYNKRTIITYLAFSNFLLDSLKEKRFDTKYLIIHQLFHLLGNSNFRYPFYKSYTMVNILRKYTFNPKIIDMPFDKINNNFTHHWNAPFNDILNKNFNFDSEITEFSLSTLEAYTYYHINKCSLVFYLGKCYSINQKCYSSIKYYIIYGYYDNKIVCYVNKKSDQRKKICSNKYGPLINNSYFDYCPNYNFSWYDKDIYSLPELKNYKTQNISLLHPSLKCPKKHPRTVYFYLNSSISNETIPKEFKIENITLKDRKYFVTYITSNHLNFEQGLSEWPLITNGLIRTFTRGSNNYDAIYSSNPEIIEDYISSLGKYMQYSRYPFYKDLDIKNKLNDFYYKMKLNFSNDYNFMTETFILPKDKIKAEEYFKNYNLTNDNLWLVKPYDQCGGDGIFFLKKYENIPSNSIITKYITNPLLLNKKKFDLRLHVIITSFRPLKIYLSKDGYVRIATNNYSLNDLNDKFCHFTNTHIGIKSKNYKYSPNFYSEEGNDWSVSTLRRYMKRNGINDTKIFNDIKDIIIKTILSVQDKWSKISKEKNLIGKKIYHFFGFDIFIDENLKSWLIEVNGKIPGITMDDPMDIRMHLEFVTSLYNLLGFVPFSHDKNMKLMDDVFIYDNYIDEIVDDSICEFERAKENLERIFPLKNNVEFYKKFWKNFTQEDLALWKKLDNYE